MARFSGGPVTHRALKGPRRTGTTLSSPEIWQREVVYTLKCIQDVREQCDRSELATVKEARRIGLSWTDIATALGVTRQSAWERWREVDDEIAATTSEQ